MQVLYVLYSRHACYITKNHGNMISFGHCIRWEAIHHALRYFSITNILYNLSFIILNVSWLRKFLKTYLYIYLYCNVIFNGYILPRIFKHVFSSQYKDNDECTLSNDAFSWSTCVLYFTCALQASPTGPNKESSSHYAVVKSKHRHIRVKWWLRVVWEIHYCVIRTVWLNTGVLCCFQCYCTHNQLE